MRQLDLHDLAGLVRYAIRIGLVSAEAEGPPRKPGVQAPVEAAA